jgi:nucleoside-diphosphate-sugar epimerase
MYGGGEREEHHIMHDGFASVRPENEQRLVGDLDSSEAFAEIEAAKLETRERHVLVIGGAGYVGCVLTDALLSRGYRVRVMDSFLYDHFHVAEGLIARFGTSLLVGDLRDMHALDQALDGITDVVLLASLVGDPISRTYPELAKAVNLQGSTAVFRALRGRGLRRFVFTSTCSNYGLWEGAEPATESAPLMPLSVYAETKVAFEQEILDGRGTIDFHPVILRLATVFGLSPRMRFDLTVNEFARAIASGIKLDVYDKDTWRPYCHVRDVCQAIASVLEAPDEVVSGEIFNVGADGNNLTKEQIVDEVLRHVAGDVSFVDGGGDRRNYRVSFAKIRDKLGFGCRYGLPTVVPQMIQAVRCGLYREDLGAPDRYGNYAVRAGVA